jgi:uncharacterized protein with ParB-like and HNH nuclease domain
MKANAVSLLAIFETKLRLEVPLFQRQYVWNLNQHWEPLWEDISRKFREYLEGRKDTPVHFLGAMVLDQKQVPTTHVDKRQVIDGQQRLTTLQLFLAAFRDFCRVECCEDLARECEIFIFNTGMMADQKIDKYKVWPTQADRLQYMNVISSGSRAELEKLHPLVRKSPRARSFNPRPRMVEAYLYFYDQIKIFFNGNKSETFLESEQSIGNRLEECFQALKNALKVVVIDLETDDDAQVIFETLNSRGEPLLPADLLRNYIFLRAARQGESQEELYEKFWRQFDDPFWRSEIKQGRLWRPRSDLFMQHFLASRQTYDIPVKHLFVEYKYWIERSRPFDNVQDELATLARQGKDFRRIIDPQKKDLLFPLANFLEVFDVRTAYPLLLLLLDAKVPDQDLFGVSKMLESYLLRRSVCGLPTKNYNRVFLQLTRSLREISPSALAVGEGLSRMTGDSTIWPDDAMFYESWMEKNVYQTLNNPKIVHILRRLSDSYLGPKSERLSIDSQLTVEHILPKNWIKHWPLQDGSMGMTAGETWLVASDDDDSRRVATMRRQALLNTFGNLTVLSQSLNSSISNSGWAVKKPELLKASLLPINLQLYDVEVWDETVIEKRGKELFKKACEIWPAPINFDG